MAKLERRPGWEHLPEYVFYDYGVCTPRVLELLENGTTKEIAKMFFNEWYDPNYSTKPHTILYQDAREILARVEGSPREKEFKKWRAVYYAFFSLQPMISEQASFYSIEIAHLNNRIKDLEAWETFLVEKELAGPMKDAELCYKVFNDLAELKHFPTKDKDGRKEIDLKAGWADIREYVEKHLIPTAGIFYAGVMALRMWAKKMKGQDFIPEQVKRDLRLRDKNYLDLIIDEEIKEHRKKRRGEIIPQQIKEEALAFTADQRGGNGEAYNSYMKRLQNFYEAYI